MPLYRFRILDKFDHVLAGQYTHLEDDDAARRHAVALQERARNLTVVIWDGARQVLRDRSGAGGERVH